MSGSNNLSYSHWKPNLSVIGNNVAPAVTAANYQNIMKLTGSAVTGGVIHQHHSPQISEEHLIPAHTAHSPHSMSRIIASPGSSNSLYSTGSSVGSSAATSIPASIPRAHQHNMPMSMIQQTSSTSSFVDQGHHLDVYSQIGMQRIGQMFKTNLMANNNNSNCNNKNPKSNRPPPPPPQHYESTMKMEQSMNNIKQLVESAIGIDAKQQIMHILEKISLLQPPERLLLYLRMPSSTSDTDPLRQPQNPLGTRSEINFTINWVRSHLEMDPNVSIPKQDVYDEYTAYCAREDVKPLSTADFGKVMKQIFPSIRPRRLGTRGNSRYCYAAMRKTTKLECPQLPNLGGTEHDTNDDPLTSSGDSGGVGGGGNSTLGSAASWNIIKTWAESLLNSEFKHPHDLADHITNNYMSGCAGTISNSSRSLLQKKLLQRKVKGRKKKSMSMSEENANDGKKRRKRRLKKLLPQSSVEASEAADNDSPPSISTTNESNVLNNNNENVQIKQEPNSKDGKMSVLKSMSQTMPINLTNEHGKVKSEVDSLDYGSSPMAAETMEMPDYSDTVCKIEIDEPTLEIEQEAIYCKKVRRAKGLSISLPSPSPKMPPSPECQTGGTLSPASMLMRPPLTEPTDLSVSSSDYGAGASHDGTFDVPNTNLLHVMPHKRNSFGAGGRIKKLRFHKHASVAGMNETKVDDIEADIIIPRERVVSICNMDKDALDDYLNEGGDSQEQEAELLQYFQTTSAHDKLPHSSVTATTTIRTATTTIMATAPADVATTTIRTASNAGATVATQMTATESIRNESSAATVGYQTLDNYQMHGNSAVTIVRGGDSGDAMTVDGAHIQQCDGNQSNLTPPENVPRKQDQINELRQYLQQNLHHQPVIQSNIIKATEDRHVTSSSHMNAANHFHGGWKGGGGGGDGGDGGGGAMRMSSAADSLTALSLPYQHANNSYDHQTENTSMLQSIGHNAAEQKLLSSGSGSMRLMRGSSVSCANASIVTTAATTAAAVTNVHHSTQQSPNSRSKNFNFVPISPGPQSPRVIQQMGTSQSSMGHATAGGRNTFLSPRRSPAVRKLLNKDLLKTLQDPSISTFDTAYKNEISASAPASPSMMPHHFQFNVGAFGPSGYAGISSGTATMTTTNPTASHQHQASCSISGMCPMLERSQSVPLHCQSPNFNAPSVSSTAYNSVCNSVAQTPVPSEYADFTEDLIEMFAESSSDHQVQKMETNEMHNLMSAANCIRSSCSRSVPSTPLPMHGFHSNPFGGGGGSGGGGGGGGGGGLMPVSTPSTTKMVIDNSKSVPTTPNFLTNSSNSNNNTNSTPFRYSPDQHRDFLINGNTIDAASKLNQFFAIQSTAMANRQSHQPQQHHHHQHHHQQQQQQQQQHQHLQINAPLEQHSSVSSTQSSAHVLLAATSTQPIEDLPNYSDVNDPIIEGSHLMNNL